MLAELAPRLVQKGYDVRCSCEKPAKGELITDYHGVKLDYFMLKPPANYTLRKAFELFYDLFFVLFYAVFCDEVYVLGIYGGVALLFPRLLGKDVVVNTDGLEWERAKYNIVESCIIILFYTISINLASKIIIDNEGLRRVIGVRHHSKVYFIPYGVAYRHQLPWDESKLRPHISKHEEAIEPGNYWLLVARLEPCNNIDTIVKGFVEANPKSPLLVVGDFTSQRYEEQVNREASNGNSGTVHFLGTIYDSETLWMLRQHCLAYLHGHSVGGTNPSLLEAMVSRNLIIAHANPFNKTVCEGSALYFSNSGDISNLVALTEQDPRGFEQLRWNAYERAAAYSWEDIAGEYDKLFKRNREIDRARGETELQLTQNET